MREFDDKEENKMVKFAHMGDCHLGGWRQPELMALNMESFRYAVNVCIKEIVEFVLIAGDLFDSAYPPIDTIKDAFHEFKRMKDANIPVFLIAGSHDYSVSGKSFLDVLEKAGFAKNVFQAEEKNGSIYLFPTHYKNFAIYGYPGKKSGLEVADISRIKLHDSPGLFKILMLHTAIRDAVGNLPIPAVEQDSLPKTDYTALAHLHVRYNKNNRVYCGPLFPNNSLELEELKGGSFCIADTSGKVEFREIRPKEVIILDFQVSSSREASEKILEEIKMHNITDKIVILRLKGILEKGRVADIKFNEIEKYAKDRGAYVLLKNISHLEAASYSGVEANSVGTEEDIIREFQEKNKNPLNNFIPSLIHALRAEKKEDEKSQVFESRLFEEARKVIGI